jgi:hypothetical protein
MTQTRAQSRCWSILFSEEKLTGNGALRQGQGSNALSGWQPLSQPVSTESHWEKDRTQKKSMWLSLELIVIDIHPRE